MAVTGRVESVTYLIILIAGSALAFNPVRLDSTVVPFHYDVELRVNVQTKRFTGEESIDLLLIEDSTEIRINNNRLDYGALRLENKETGKVFVPHQSYSMFDDYSEVLYIQFAEVVPGATNYTLHISEIGGRFGAGLEENYIGVNGCVADEYSAPMVIQFWFISCRCVKGHLIRHSPEVDYFQANQVIRGYLLPDMSSQQELMSQIFEL